MIDFARSIRFDRVSWKRNDTRATGVGGWADTAARCRGCTTTVVVYVVET